MGGTALKDDTMRISSDSFPSLWQLIAWYDMVLSEILVVIAFLPNLLVFLFCHMSFLPFRACY